MDMQQQQQQHCNMSMELISDVRVNIPVDVTFTDFVFQRAEQFGDHMALVGWV
jgi:hypothetical protein